MERGVRRGRIVHRRTLQSIHQIVGLLPPMPRVLLAANAAHDHEIRTRTMATPPVIIAMVLVREDRRCERPAGNSDSVRMQSLVRIRRPSSYLSAVAHGDWSSVSCCCLLSTSAASSGFSWEFTISLDSVSCLQRNWNTQAAAPLAARHGDPKPVNYVRSFN